MESVGYHTLYSSLICGQWTSSSHPIVSYATILKGGNTLLSPHPITKIPFKHTSLLSIQLTTQLRFPQPAWISLHTTTQLPTNNFSLVDERQAAHTQKMRTD